MDGYSFCGERTYSLTINPSWLVIDDKELQITSSQMNDAQELEDASITVSLVEAVGPVETITFKVAIYSNDPTVAILAPCGGSYVKRPADIRDMTTEVLSDVRDKEDVPDPYDVYDTESEDCTFDFVLEG